jgi:hypothetical protein
VKKLILAALVCGAAFAFPASAMADPAICHDGVLSDDAGQGCADGLYAAAYGSGGTSNWAICHDGIASDDAGHGCAGSSYTSTSYGGSTSYSYSGAGGTLAAIRQCESGGSGGYSADTGNGYYGAYQFTLGTWASVGGTGNPAAASPAEQDRRAAILYARSGSAPWPVCGR